MSRWLKSTFCPLTSLVSRVLRGCFRKTSSKPARARRTGPGDVSANPTQRSSQLTSIVWPGSSSEILCSVEAFIARLRKQCRLVLCVSPHSDVGAFLLSFLHLWVSLQWSEASHIRFFGMSHASVRSYRKRFVGWNGPQPVEASNLWRMCQFCACLKWTSNYWQQKPSTSGPCPMWHRRNAKTKKQTNIF